MSKKPSDATLLRHSKRVVKDLERRLEAALSDREAYRSRATKAEQDAADWRRRFDILLVRSPVAVPSKPEVADERMQRCIDLVRLDPEQNYIPSIKLHRELFGSGLKEAKDAMEPWRDQFRFALSAGAESK